MPENLVLSSVILSDINKSGIGHVEGTGKIVLVN